MKTEARVDEEVADALRAYRALDSPVRLRAFTVIRKDPGISFNALAKELGLASGLAAYHVGVLKAAQVVAVNYGRAGKETSRYRLTDRGAQIYEQLFGADDQTTRHLKASKVTRTTRRAATASGRR
jgi:predicted transcriptional regulator